MEVSGSVAALEVFCHGSRTNRTRPSWTGPKPSPFARSAKSEPPVTAKSKPWSQLPQWYHSSVNEVNCGNHGDGEGWPTRLYIRCGRGCRSRRFSADRHKPLHPILSSLTRFFQMEQHRVSPEKYRREVLAYHGLPVVTALLLVGIFLAGFFFTGSMLLSGLAALLTSLLLVWRWALAGRQIDRWGCPKCGGTLPRKIYWKYPPNVCPRCGEKLDA